MRKCPEELNENFTTRKTPEQVKEKIGKSFERFCGFCPPFEYIKAVSDKLVSPTNIIEWDVKVIKHQTGLGPLYIRALSKINLNHFPKVNHASCLSSESSSDEDKDQESLLKSSVYTVDNGKLPKQPKMAASNSCTTMQDTCATNNDSTHLPMAVQDTTSNSRLTDKEVSSKDNTEKLVPCPICHRVFLSTVIQVHANNCMDIMNRVESKAYDDLIFDVEPIPVQEDYEEPAGPNSNGDLSNSNENACITNPNDVHHAIKEAVKEICLNVNKDSNRLYVRRKTMWKDFVDAHKKWWIKWDKTLDITFLDEPAVDDGWPKREFFGGELYRLLLSFYRVFQALQF